MSDSTEHQQLDPTENDPVDEIAGSVLLDGLFDDSEERESHTPLPYPVVGIGASAGGVEAYIELFQNLPANTGMAFVVVPHLSADAKSFLPEIIARHTSMDTLDIENGIRPQPNRIYFLPPNAQVSLEKGKFRLRGRQDDGPPRPIDYFFRSLASDQKNRAIGVVLSGMDSDGALGLKAIKGEGGIAMVQSPESAKFPDMPRSSISADHVDIVLPPGQIAFELGQLSRQFQNSEVSLLNDGIPTGDEQQIARVFSLLRGVSGVDFRMYKPTTIRRRIARRMLLHRVATLADYVAFLQANPKEVRDLQEDSLINVTRFFRDPDVFDALKNVVLPQIFRDCPPDQQVRMWVAGCSTGEEVYSIAMCVLEHLTGNPLEPSIQIFGTDASEQNIHRARSGFYPETIAGDVSPERIRRFFVRNDKGYQVAKRVRDLCIFARQNVTHDPPFSRMDLISCRNVLIYFGDELQRQLIPIFHYALRPNGFLLLGTSENIREFTDGFALADRRHKIFSKVGATPIRGLAEVLPRIFLPDNSSGVQCWQPADTRGELELQRAADRIVLARYGPPGVVVDENGDILQSRGHTSPFFEMPQGSATFQLSRMARESIAPQITAALKRAIEEDIPVQVEGLQVPNGDHVQETTLEVLPIQSLTAPAKCYLVLFPHPSRLPGSNANTSAQPPLVTAGEDKDRLIVQMRQDLSSSRVYLQSLLEERDGKNQELVSANEEIQSANEELQSTNEELETTKEELQSSNEELQTVNDELQNRNTILTQASNDLSNLLNSVNLPVLMLSNELNIRHFTPPTQRLMNLRATDVGRPFGEIRINLNIDDLQPLFSEVLETLGAREIEVQDRAGHWYLLRVRPYRTTDNKIEGLVVVLVDIDQLRRIQQELKDSRDYARSIIESIPLPLAVLDVELKIRSTNQAFCALAGPTSQELEGRFFPDLAAVLWGLDQPIRSYLAELREAEKGSSFQFECKTSGEPSKTFLIRGRLLQPDGEQFLLVTFEEITAHKEVERLLNIERGRLADQVESTTKELDRSQHELRALTGQLFTVQEQERRRVARELHDDISQRLAKLDLDSDGIGRQIDSDPDAAKQRLQQVRSELAELAVDVRRVSHALHPSILEDLGLSAAIKSLVQEFGERESMITTFSGQVAREAIPIDVATGLYRITQEALRNVAKHAGRTHIKVNLMPVNGGVRLQVTDSGFGFDLADSRSGLGLISMEERTRLMGGTLHVQSALGKGTEVTVNVPLPHRDDVQ